MKILGIVSSSGAKTPWLYKIPNASQQSEIIDSVVYKNNSGNNTAIFLTKDIVSSSNVFMTQTGREWKSYTTYSGHTTTALATGYNAYRGSSNFGAFGYTNNGEVGFATLLHHSDPWSMSQSTFTSTARQYGDPNAYGKKIKSALYFSHPQNYFYPQNDGYVLLAENNSAALFLDYTNNAYSYQGAAGYPIPQPKKIYRGLTETIAIGTNTNLCSKTPYSPSEHYVKTLPFSANWTDVKYLNGTYYMLAENTNKYAYSTDSGDTWLEGDFGSTQNWSSISYGNGKFVAVAKDTEFIAVSTNGQSWTMQSIGKIRKWSAVQFVNGIFVIASGGDSLYPNTYAFAEAAKI